MNFIQHYVSQSLDKYSICFDYLNRKSYSFKTLLMYDARLQSCTQHANQSRKLPKPRHLHHMTFYINFKCCKYTCIIFFPFCFKIYVIQFKSSNSYDMYVSYLNFPVLFMNRLNKTKVAKFSDVRFSFEFRHRLQGCSAHPRIISFFTLIDTL
jgi:hypothetical protein